jgi:hypothetical protein
VGGLVEQPGDSTDEGSSWHKPNNVGHASFAARFGDELYASRHGSYPYQNLGECEQVLALFSRRNNAVGQLSLERPPPAGDDVVLSLDSRFAPCSQKRQVLLRTHLHMTKLNLKNQNQNRRSRILTYVSRHDGRKIFFACYGGSPKQNTRVFCILVKKAQLN